MKYVPKRTCIACRQEKDKSELIRIVRAKDGDISLDISGKSDGRGAYVCKTEDCVKKCIKSRALNRTFKCEVKGATYEKILEEYLIAKRQN